MGRLNHFCFKCAWSIIYILVTLTACGGQTGSIDSESATIDIDRGSATPGAESIDNQQAPVTEPELPYGLSLHPQEVTSSTTIAAIFVRRPEQDSEELQFTYSWKINGNVVAQEEFDFLSSRLLTRDDVVIAKLLVSNGSSEESYTATVEILNSLPEARIEFASPVATVSTEIILAMPYLADADDDPVEVVYHWSVNGQPIVSEHSSSLAPGYVVMGDVVAAYAELSDGIATVLTRSVSMDITDAPSVLDTQFVPKQFLYNEQSNFKVMFTDPDNTATTTALVDGPSGFTYDTSTNTASWNPDSFMLSSVEAFTATFQSSDGQKKPLLLTVVDPGRLPPLAKSGVDVPDRHVIQMDIGDFDKDGKVEILSSDLDQRIFTLEFDGKALIQDWLYPFALPDGQSIGRLWSHGDDSDEIIAVTTNAVLHISSRNLQAEILYRTDKEIVTSAYADVESDGDKEVILVTDEGEIYIFQTELGDVSILPYMLGTLPREARIWSEGVHSIILANVDSDASLEIISGTGEVVDALTGTIDWKHSDRFGSHLAMGDIDGNGVDELVASDRWSNLKIFDIDTRSEIAEYEIDDTCNLITYNIDQDPQDEIFLSGCQSDELEIYDISTGIAETDLILSDWMLFSSSPDSMSVGDIDNDGISELVFATGTHTTGANAMGVASFPGLGDLTPDGFVLNNRPGEAGWFQLIGWDTGSSGQLRAVLNMPETDTAPSSWGHRIGLLTETGELVVSEVTQKNWNKASTGFVVDSDGDGVNEVVVGVDDTSRGILEHRNLDDDFSLRLSIDSFANGATPSIISQALVIGGGSPVAVLAKSDNTLEAIDLRLGASFWSSESLDETVRHVIAIDAVSDSRIVTATNNDLTVWNSMASGYAKRSSAAVSCDLISSMKQKGEYVIVCVKNSSNLEDTKIVLLDTNLVKQSVSSVDYDITALHDHGSGYLIAGSGIEEYGSRSGYKDRSHVHLLNPVTGTTTWTSMPLLGSINAISIYDNPGSGKRKLGISTSLAVYINR